MTTTPQAALLSESEIVACIAKAGCIGTVKMSYESGPYDIDRPSINASRLYDAIEVAILAKLQAATPAEPAQSKCLTCNGHGLIGGHMQDGSGYGEGCPDCNPEPVQAGELPDGLALVVEKLERFQECAEDSDAGGCDIGREWFDALTTIGLLRRTQRSPGLWEMTSSGSAVLARAALSARKPLSDDLYCRLHTLSKILESSGLIDEQETRDAYPTILDAMNFVRGIGLEVKP